MISLTDFPPGRSRPGRFFKDPVSACNPSGKREVEKKMTSTFWMRTEGEHGPAGLSLFYPGSLLPREVRMQQTLFQVRSSQTGGAKIYVLSHQVFRAMHPMERLMAQALERVGKTPD